MSPSLWPFFQGQKILKRLEPEDEFILTLAAAAAATAGQSRLPSSANNLRFIVGNSSHTPSITLTALLHCPSRTPVHERLCDLCFYAQLSYLVLDTEADCRQVRLLSEPATG